MNKTELTTKIESTFRKQVQKDSKVKSAFLLVHSDKLDIEINIAEGENEGVVAHTEQPHHMASVGKLFTSTLVGMLFDENLLDYNDPISKFLDDDLMRGLHVYKGKEYSGEITIRHLLMQTSGLFDVFYDLLKKMRGNLDFRITTREAVEWGKANLKPVSAPGKKHHYTDTNYYLLGLIVESITGKTFAEVMHEKIFKPLGMDHSWMFGFSEPASIPALPMAKLYIEDFEFSSIEGIWNIDYAGGSVASTSQDLLLFMKSLLHGKLVSAETLNQMISDDLYMGFPYLGFNYGYGIWKLRSIPLFVPKSYYCWGGVGVTGAFMFYHPVSETILIGTFNDFSYRGKALEFMVKKVIKPLLKFQRNNEK